MNKALMSTTFAVCLLASSAALAAEKTVTLAVKNMYCAACPHTVKASLERVPGVAKVAVSYKDKTAIVTFDDEKTGVNALTAATTNAGYPSAPKG
ncbi:MULTISPECIES: mercury resistance system periplasmic binding protein MerP [unclassified Bradyrhizobium]|uniref:mercury resistance system periplasmic binding protein MerP n=1 Tax=unclassified Bradyrhizobium TaxID=2631580 RepID=UPI00247AA3DC|nr:MULTISPECIES: mercury resistance system periplasmic binding protein MerP [unclassified Bradyrhizobium]WGR71331.1 mercury resistance system periplasmic binding protein MerP [Bradyrhizobium sp. ISRA426]WGR76166.1 mercury resistance system periplasmic binding protein MerP [Bradyrhizobium sp. ISRA430]WGR86571.1 mercury resistance system periplasmic binding protein MerP [Bradyrhizobium sp. ISRA432]